MPSFYFRKPVHQVQALIIIFTLLFFSISPLGLAQNSEDQKSSLQEIKNDLDVSPPAALPLPGLLLKFEPPIHYHSDCNGNPINLSKSFEARIVCFPGPDGLTLRGVLYKGTGANLPALVVLHGSGGLYHDNGGDVEVINNGKVELYAEGISSNLDQLPLLFSQNHGLGLIVDSFSPRNYDPDQDPNGEEPEGIEVAKDAQFAKAFLNSLRGGNNEKITNGNFALVGFSHGGGATVISSVEDGNPIEDFITGPEFKYYGNFYGGCGKIFEIEGNALYKNRAPMTMFHGTLDSISEHCPALLAEANQAQAVDLELEYYNGAVHGFFYKAGIANLLAKANSLTIIKADFNHWLGTSF